jgi:hypothetical protein
MGPIPFVACAAVLVAAALAPPPALAQWNNQPYSYRSSSGGTGMSDAYRQAIIDRELFGREPRNLVRSADGSRLLEVIEQDDQAFLADREPNILPEREFAPPVAGLRLRVGGAGGSAAIDGWTAMLDGIRPLD